MSWQQWDEEHKGGDGGSSPSFSMPKTAAGQTASGVEGHVKAAQYHEEAASHILKSGMTSEAAGASAYGAHVDAAEAHRTAASKAMYADPSVKSSWFGGSKANRESARATKVAQSASRKANSRGIVFGD